MLSQGEDLSSNEFHRINCVLDLLKVLNSNVAPLDWFVCLLILYNEK